MGKVGLIFSRVVRTGFTGRPIFSKNAILATFTRLFKFLNFNEIFVIRLSIIWYTTFESYESLLYEK